LPKKCCRDAFPTTLPKILNRNTIFAPDFQFPKNSAKEQELPEFDFGQLQHDANVSLLMLSHDSYNFGSIAGNSFRPTEEEAHMTGMSSFHKKRS
jgi:hypothetical protein